MIKIRSISLVLVCSGLLVSPAFAGLPTIDAGNIAGTVGIVTQGATGIQQGMGIITNGADLNSIIGDSAGSLGKFLPGGIGGDDKDAKSFQDALNRINEGTKAFQKIQEDAKAKEEQYQALMDTVNSKKEQSTKAYDDSDDTEYVDETEYSATDEQDYDIDNTATLGLVKQGAVLSPDGVVQMAPTSNAMPTAVQPRTMLKAVSGDVVSQGVPSEAGLRAVPVATEEQPVEEGAGTEEVQNNVEEGIALDMKKRAFGRVSLTGAAEQANTRVLTGVAKSGALDGAKFEKVKTKAVESRSQSGALSLERAADAGTTGATSGVRKSFRVSPKASSALKTDKLSSNTKSFSTRLMFAAKKSSNTKGVNTDTYGNFISALPQRCGISVDDLSDEAKLNECLQKIISENHASNQYDAINSRKECEQMIYNTVVALMAETTSMKVEASTYKDTLDEQEDLGGDSNNTRDDTNLLAMTNEQIQILLNRMSLLTSSQILLDTVKQLCAMSKDIADANTDSGDNDGEE